MEYEKTEIEAAVRGILMKAHNAGNAVVLLTIMHGQYLPRGVSFLSGPSVVFDNRGRRAHFSLARGQDDLMPMEINVEVAA